VHLRQIWTKYTVVVDLPNINGKTLGNAFNQTDCLGLNFWLNSGSTFGARSNNIGQTGQGGIFEIAHVSLSEGDVSYLTDPYMIESEAEEIERCQRYFERMHGAFAGSVDTIASSRADGGGQYILRWDYATPKALYTPSVTLTLSTGSFSVYTSMRLTCQILNSSGTSGSLYAIPAQLQMRRSKP
jgi:hypothetical protein